jgi:hypothetical protein
MDTLSTSELVVVQGAFLDVFFGDVVKVGVALD